MSYIQTLQSAPLAHLDELWYIGRTSNIVERFARHQKGSGARCLVGRPNIVMTKLEKELPFLELTRTLELMAKQGPAKVRGGPFVKQAHSSEDLAMIQVLLDSESFARKDDSDRNLHEVASEASETASSEKAETASKRSRADSDAEVHFARAGKPWTSDEHQALRNLIWDTTSKEIAERKMQRKVSALDAMTRKLISTRISQGHSLEDIGSFLKKDAEQVQEVLSGASFFQ